MLCERMFPSRDKLDAHVKQSALHSTNFRKAVADKRITGSVRSRVRLASGLCAVSGIGWSRGSAKQSVRMLPPNFVRFAAAMWCNEMWVSGQWLWRTGRASRHRGRSLRAIADGR